MKKAIIVLAMLIPMMVSAADYGQLKFTWDANTEPDMAEYRLYINGGDAIAIQHPTTEYIYPVPAEGDYTAYITAVDTSGNESGPSESCNITIDIPPGTPTCSVSWEASK